MPTLRLHCLLPASHGEGVLALLSGFLKCPGLFYATPAQDGILSRIRIPGGIINSKQCYAIADIADQYGGGYVDITNRANLQVREIHTGINAEVLKRLQNLGLGSRNSAVDHIRNIMTSPTAGIDPQELIDTRPFVQGWDNYIATHPALGELSAKFSVCFDGGGSVRVCDRLNDIVFAAVLVAGRVYFRLFLSVGAKGEPPQDTGVLLLPEQCLPVLVALADVYWQYVNNISAGVVENKNELTNRHRVASLIGEEAKNAKNKRDESYLSNMRLASGRKLRLREVVNSLSCESYLRQVEERLSFSLLRGQNFLSTNVSEDLTPLSPSLLGKEEEYHHIGIHSQRQTGLFYIGVVLPLGRLESWQLRGLADLSVKYGSGTLRLTPWQNLLLTDIPQEYLVDVQRELTVIELDSSPTNIKSALVACSGKRGCAAAVTDTKADALALVRYLETRVTLNRPVNIHFSGCEKSCAQHSNSDIALLGVSVETENGIVEGYQVYVGEGDGNKFGRELFQYVSFAELSPLIERMLNVYKINQKHSDESFGEFANRYAIAQLKQLFSNSSVSPSLLLTP